jgi:hypothetical protein
MLVDWDIFLTYCAWKSFSVCVLGWSWYIYALWVAVLRIFLFGIHLTAVLNTILFLELTGSNGIFGDISGWFWFRNMTSSGSQHNVWQMDPLENWLLLKLDVQIPKVSWLRWAFPLAHAEPSVALPQICISLRFSGDSPHLSCRPVT